jgi:hypothetical protein
MLDPSVLLLLLPILAILGLRWRIGSPHEQIELNRQVRSSLERAVTNCKRIDLHLGITSSTDASSEGLETGHEDCPDRSKLVAELQVLRARLHDRHEQFGNMTVGQLREKLKEIHALELESLRLLDAARHQTRPGLTTVSGMVLGEIAEAQPIKLDPAARQVARPTLRPIG